ncbi:MAG: alpha/beta hydrolase [Acetobacteraceae bacterium]|nr:alpha/beta hydrolase [Acetobacteraceae bacterium]
MRVLTLLWLLILAWPLPAAAVDRFVSTSDGVRLHVVDVGQAHAAPDAPVLVFVPGWTMPEWIFQPQIDEFSKHYRVIAIDPRGQGESDVPKAGYVHTRRGQDIAEVIDSLHLQHVVLIGWSLGVLDSLAYVRLHGDQALAGLVLIDNSVGEEPAPAASKDKSAPGGRKLSHAEFMAAFVRGMFHRPQPASFLNRLTQACLRTPERAADQLLAYPVPRSYWKEAVYSTTRPVLYVVRPKFAGQAGNLAAHHKAAETMVVDGLGHALFVDDPARFNATLADFLVRKVAK